LLLYLFVNHGNANSALETSLKFMNKSIEYLRAGDFAKTKTGVQRFITNTRFAALELRKYGFLRSDKKHFYKYWELSLFGIIVAGKIYSGYKSDLANSYFNNFAWYKAQESTNKILRYYVGNCQRQEQFRHLIKYLFEDEVVADQYKLYNKNFFEFANKILSALNDNFNNKFDSYDDFVTYLNNFNMDKEATSLADSIRLRKDIEINMKDIFNIINFYRNPTD